MLLLSYTGRIVAASFVTQAEEAARALDAELASVRKQAGHLEATTKAREAEITRLTKLLDQAKVSGVDQKSHVVESTRDLLAKAWGQVARHFALCRQGGTKLLEQGANMALPVQRA